MEKRIKIGIVGYGNLGKGVELALKQNPDFHLEAIFTRRDTTALDSEGKVEHISNLGQYKGRIDVMILCGGSATDLGEQAPEIAASFNTVDSFDTHAHIPEYFNKLDQVSRKAGTLGLISAGWDPGLFSINRLFGEAILPVGREYTFWGIGVSQGHSDAIRRVPGVKNGIQYTIPLDDALNRIRSGENPQFSGGEMHERVCYVVAEPGADYDKIAEEIKSMPNYFAPYSTTVHFISEEELKAKHAGMPHGGFAIRTGTTGNGTRQRLEFNLQLESNPEFTASVLVAYTRAVYRMSQEGQTGARTVFDIPPAYLSPKSGAQLREELL